MAEAMYSRPVTLANCCDSARSGKPEEVADSDTFEERTKQLQQLDAPDADAVHQPVHSPFQIEPILPEATDGGRQLVHTALNPAGAPPESNLEGSKQLNGSDRQSSLSGSELRNPASPGCVYSGLQLELHPGGGEFSIGCGGVSPEARDLVVDDPESATSAPCIDALTGGAYSPLQAGERLDTSHAVSGHEQSRNQLHGGPCANADDGQRLQIVVGSTTPIQPLPPASQIDSSVLDALPLQMKREIERAYGETELLTRCVADCFDCQSSHSSKTVYKAEHRGMTYAMSFGIQSL